ncbi:hypothetical protein QJS67_04915 [Acinetobacter radioresistens]|nr:hypothetical protein QJS67_04915 [Acinetobacter radioresistens]
MMQTERDYALSQKTWLDRQRFRPQQWSYREKWKVYNPDAGEGWYGFNSVRDLDGLPPEILFVPLSGHTHGHAGIAIQAGDKWLLNAADAYFYHKEIDPVSPCCTPGLRFTRPCWKKTVKRVSLIRPVYASFISTMHMKLIYFARMIVMILNA